MRSHAALLLPLAALTLALTACGGGIPVPAADEPTPATATPHPTPTEAADSDFPVALQVSSSGVEIIRASGTSEWVFFNNPAADAVATFTDAFAAPPVVTDRPGGLEAAPARVYDWSGFSIIDVEGLTINLTDYVIDVSVASVGGIDILTVPGLQVGDPFASAVSVEDSDGGFPGIGLAAVDTQPVDPALVGEPAGSPLAVFVAVYGPASGSGAITHFTAPTPNWGV